MTTPRLITPVACSSALTCPASQLLLRPHGSVLPLTPPLRFFFFFLFVRLFLSEQRRSRPSLRSYRTAARRRSRRRRSWRKGWRLSPPTTLPPRPPLRPPSRRAAPRRARPPSPRPRRRRSSSRRPSWRRARSRRRRRRPERRSEWPLHPPHLGGTATVKHFPLCDVRQTPDLHPRCRTCTQL